MNDSNTKAIDFEKKFPRISELSRFSREIHNMVSVYLQGSIGINDLIEWIVLWQDRELRMNEKKELSILGGFSKADIFLDTEYLDSFGNPKWIKHNP